jgi:Protein of unknown function (DUF4435)
MVETDLPQRSSDGLAALDIFYDDFNDVHFFVEDIDQENLYELILRKLFPELRVARVFPLGGKQAVLNRCTHDSQQRSAPPSVYIVDKDFDDLLRRRLSHPFLFYLDRYCIENYFAEPDAIIDVIIESLPKLNRSEVSASLCLPAKLIELAESMRPLFQLFYGVQFYDLGIKNCALAPEIFCQKSRRWIIDQRAVEKYCEQVSQAALTTPHSLALSAPFTDGEIAKLKSLDCHSVVSGKYICSLLFHYIRSEHNLGTITFESFLFRLAKNASLSSLSSLAEAIRAAVVRTNATTCQRA